MPDVPRWERPAGPSRAGRRVGRALVFVAVVVVAVLLGRFGDGVDEGPALEVDRSSRTSAPAPTPTPRTAARPAVGSWTRLPDPGLAGRDAHTAVWTGRAVLVWGGHGPFGSGDGRHADGVAYQPDVGWLGVPPAPLDGLVHHTAVWADGEMLVWSGAGSGQRGAAYDPDTQRWRLLAPDPLPQLSSHTAVWTGPLGDRAGEMLVWGGTASGTPTGAAYDPAADRWRSLPDAPAGSRTGFTATWTGREMVVVGGTHGQGDAAAAGASPGGGSTAGAFAYDPVADAWRVLPTPPGRARKAHTAVWTGDELLVWGGVGPDGRPAVPAGLSYAPAADTWAELPAAPGGARVGHAAVWTGDRMVVWGGTAPGDGAAGLVYDPAARVWRELSAPGDARTPSRVVWTGEQLIVLDGRSLAGALAHTPPARPGARR